MSSESTSVSIIITVKNNGIDLYTTMESLKVSQSTLPYEVIIVDEGSVDGCCDFLMSYRFDRPFKRVKGDPGISARNLGAAYATGEVLIFCGSHLYYDDGWMERLLAPLMRGQAEGVSPAFEMGKHSPAPKGRNVGGWWDRFAGIRFGSRVRTRSPGCLGNALLFDGILFGTWAGWKTVLSARIWKRRSFP